MKTLARLATSLVIGAVALLLAATPAFAASLAFADPVGDQMVYRGSPSAAQQAHSDLTKVSIAHVPGGKVRLRWKVRDLRSDYKVPWFALNFSRGVVSNPHQSNTFWVQWGRNLRCSVTGVKDYGANTVTATFPRRCFPRGGRMSGLYAQAEWFNGSKSRWVYDPSATAAGSFVPNP